MFQIHFNSVDVTVAMTAKRLAESLSIHGTVRAELANDSVQVSFSTESYDTVLKFAELVTPDPELFYQFMHDNVVFLNAIDRAVGTQVPRQPQLAQAAE